MNHNNCEDSCGGKWCTNEPISKETTPSEPQENCDYGNRGNGICLKVGECCSQYGWCGVTSEHCGLAPTAAPIGDGDDHNQNKTNVTGIETITAGLDALSSPPPTPTEVV
jgi:hypothetical protein